MNVEMILKSIQKEFEFNPGYGWGDAFLLIVASIFCVLAFIRIARIAGRNNYANASEEQRQKNEIAYQENEREIKTFDFLNSKRGK